MKKKSPPESQSWREEAYPQMHYLLLAQDGDGEAGRWLEDNSRSVALLSRALTGQPAALGRLEEDGCCVELDDLFEMIDNEDLVAWLAERRPDLHLLFEAIQGDPEATDRLRRKRPGFARLVGPLRRVHEAFLHRHPNDGQIEGDAASDMGCLIGEMHLRQGEYHKAVEAFSRAIENHPAPDLYEGRARAYHALAGADETRARDLRQRER